MSGLVPSGPHRGAFNLFPGFLRPVQTLFPTKDVPLLLETFVQLVVFAAPLHRLTSLVEEL